MSDGQGADGTRVCEHGRFEGAIRLTWRLFRSTAGILLLVAAISGAVTLVVAMLLGGTTSSNVVTGGSLGVSVVNEGAGRHLTLNVPSLVVGLVGLVVGIWASVTMVRMLLSYLSDGRRPTHRDLGCGLPYFGWALVAALLLRLVYTGLGVLPPLAGGNSVTPLDLLASVLEALVAVATVFYVQSIVDAGCNGPASLWRSWLLVRGVGFWRVLGVCLLAGLCVAPLVIVVPTLIAGLTQAGAGSVVAQFVVTVVITPLSAAFTTVLYRMARGDRERLDAVLSRAAGEASPQVGGPAA